MNQNQNQEQEQDRQLREHWENAMRSSADQLHQLADHAYDLDRASMDAIATIVVGMVIQLVSLGGEGDADGNH